MTNVAIFASGAGSNALNLIQYFKNRTTVHIACVACNVPTAGVIAKANAEGVPVVLFDKTVFNNKDEFTKVLNAYNVQFIVLAGFLWKVPEYLIELFPNRIINVHPALLPSYGGKGMYGMHVHTAVIANRETQSGITIHYVNAHYDEGAIIMQYITPILPNDTVETLAYNIHALEQMYLPQVVEQVIKALNSPIEA
jgi:phosphoribosylglycinamide formyltransferase 1